MLDKKTIDQILKIQGKTRGVVFQTDAEYVEQKEGKDGLLKLEQTIKKIEQPLPYGKKAKATAWYPLSWRVLSLVLIKDLFNWDDQEIFKMGESAPKHSFVVKTLLRYFISIEKTFTESAKYWQEHYSVGTLSAPEIDNKNNHLVIRVSDFKIHPILCAYYKGYFKAISQLVVRSKEMTIQETKCAFKGDDFCEYTIDWK